MKLSFVIPTKNEESVLATTLQQFRVLPSGSYEIIVSDGGSTDATQRITEEYQGRFVAWVKPEKQTIALGRNLGAAQATGDVLFFLDADVIIPNLTTLVATAQTMLTADTQLVALTCPVRFAPGVETRTDALIWTMSALWSYVKNNIMHTGASMGETMIVRRAAFENIQGFRNDFAAGEDQDLFMRLARMGKTRMLWHFPVYGSPRRMRKHGWFNLLVTWKLNYYSQKLFGRPYSKEWKQVK